MQKQPTRVKGPSHPQRKAPGFFESISRTPQRKFIMVRHDTREAAERRLAGVPRHDFKQVIDHTPKAK